MSEEQVHPLVLQPPIGILVSISAAAQGSTHYMPLSNEPAPHAYVAGD